MNEIIENAWLNRELLKDPKTQSTIREIIDVKKVREAENWDQHPRIEDVMDQPSFVHLRSYVWKLLRDQHGSEVH